MDQPVKAFIITYTALGELLPRTMVIEANSMALALSHIDKVIPTYLLNRMVVEETTSYKI